MTSDLTVLKYSVIDGSEVTIGDLIVKVSDIICIDIVEITEHYSSDDQF